MAHTAKRNGIDIVLEFRADPNIKNYTGAYAPALNGYVVYCEECSEIVGIGEDIRDAYNDADDNDAVTDRSDEGSGDTHCLACYERLVDEAMADAMRSYEADYYTRAAEAAEDERDNFLAAADLAFDTMRERGEI